MSGTSTERVGRHGGPRCTIQYEVEGIDAKLTQPVVRSQFLTYGRFRFRLLVHPKGTRSSRGHISAFVEADVGEALVANLSFPNVKYTITLVNRLSEERNVTMADTWTFHKNGIDRGWHDFIRIDDAMDKDAGWLGPKNSLLFRGSASCDISDSAWEAMLLPEAAAHHSLKSDFSGLLSSGWLSDVTLRAGDQELKVHKLILAARSPVFKQMLSSEMTEASTGIVNISDIEPDILNHLCGFMYSGEIQETVWESENAVFGLMRAASKYELGSLLCLCATRAEAGICVENVAEWLLVSVELNAEGLKTYCMTFVARHLSDVQATEGWKRLMKDKNMVFEIATLLFETISPPPAKKAKQ